MIVNLITEITIIGILDRGIPNLERIVLKVNETLNLGQYGLMLGVRTGSGLAHPVRDNLLWLGDGMVNMGDWIFIYTGPGKPTSSNLPNTQERLYSIHWGREYTILRDPNLVPILFKIDAVQVPAETSGLLPPTSSSTS